MRRPRDNVVVHRSDPAPRIRSPASDRRIRSPDGTFDNERGPTFVNLAAFPAKAGRFPPGEAGLNERGELQSIVPIASSAPLRRESRRRALKRHGPDPGQLPVASAELPASGGMRAAGPFGGSPPPGGQGGRSNSLSDCLRSPVLGLSVQPRWTSDGISDLQVPGPLGLGPPRGVGGRLRAAGPVLRARDLPRSAVPFGDGGRRPEARPILGAGAGRTTNSP